MDSDKKVPEQKQGLQYKKTEEFRETYSNNVFLESSLWDMKLIFGKLDQQLGPSMIVQDTAVTVPWSQVKLIRYFLGLHLISHELQNGRIQIPSNIVPSIPDELPKGVLEDLPLEKAHEIHTALKECYDDFIAANPEAKRVVGSNKS
jgi:hypothetical protein